MFCTRYFADRHYAPRYWPKVGAAAPVVTLTSHYVHTPGAIGSPFTVANVYTFTATLEERH